MDGWVDKRKGGFEMGGWGKIKFLCKQSLSILLNPFDLILTLKILRCAVGNFHALEQSNAIYNEWLFIDIMRADRSIVNGLHGGDTLEIKRKAINAFALLLPTDWFHIQD